MAKKILKTRTQFTSTLETDLYRRLQQMSKETKIPISRLLDSAVLKLRMDYMKKVAPEFYGNTIRDEKDV